MSTEDLRCVGCRVTLSTPSPSASTAPTLISATHGWRLNRRTTPSGERVLEWRCPRCWDRYKRAKSWASEYYDPMPSLVGFGSLTTRRRAG